MSLLVAVFCPEYFKASGAYAPITDLENWTYQNANYRDHGLACCGNDFKEMKERSPVFYLENIARANIKIFHEKFDSVVPASHNLELYEEIMSKHPKARVFLDVFDGGHEIDMRIAFYWLILQYAGTKKIKITG